MGGIEREKQKIDQNELVSLQRDNLLLRLRCFHVFSKVKLYAVDEGKQRGQFILFSVVFTPPPLKLPRQFLASYLSSLYSLL